MGVCCLVVCSIYKVLNCILQYIVASVINIEGSGTLLDQVYIKGVGGESDAIEEMDGLRTSVC